MKTAVQAESMALHADFSLPARVHASSLPWTPSPVPGVLRRMLDRIGGEVARATSIVRYAAGSRFSPHVHAGGEEFLVLDGVFQDEHGDYPAGTYVRNPPQSRHTPGSRDGCTLLVKLWQFHPADAQPVVIDTNSAPWQDCATPGCQAAMPLFYSFDEWVRLERWAPQARVFAQAGDGLEVFVLEGDFEESGERFAPWDWLRWPRGLSFEAHSGAQGCVAWVKSGHLKPPLRIPPGVVGQDPLGLSKAS